MSLAARTGAHGINTIHSMPLLNMRWLGLGARSAIRAPVSAALRMPCRSIMTLVRQPAAPEDEDVLKGDTLGVTLTENARNVCTPCRHTNSQKLKSVADAENDPELALRVIVEPGGCHGYVYKLDLTNKVEKDDLYV